MIDPQWSEDYGRRVDDWEVVSGTPTHYDKPIQPWDYIIANDLGFLEGNVVKYITRWRDKNGVEDLRKCRAYIDKLLEVHDDSRQVKEGAGIQAP